MFWFLMAIEVRSATANIMSREKDESVCIHSLTHCVLFFFFTQSLRLTVITS